MAKRKPRNLDLRIVRAPTECLTQADIEGGRHFLFFYREQDESPTAREESWTAAGLLTREDVLSLAPLRLGRGLTPGQGRAFCAAPYQDHRFVVERTRADAQARRFKRRGRPATQPQ